jgi:hypothetical protein
MADKRFLDCADLVRGGGTDREQLARMLDELAHQGVPPPDGHSHAPSVYWDHRDGRRYVVHLFTTSSIPNGLFLYAGGYTTRDPRVDQVARVVKEQCCG